MFQKCKKLTALILSVVLLVAMAAIPASADAGVVHDDHDHVHELEGAVSIKGVGISGILYAGGSSDPGHVHSFSGGEWLVGVTNFCGYSSIDLFVQTCSCGAKYTSAARNYVSSSGGHNITTTSVSAGCSAHLGTCETCTVCGYILKYIPGSGHDYNTPGQTVQPTCTTDGYTVMSCACGETQQKPIPATGHVWKETSTGLCVNSKECTVCGEVMSGQDHLWKWMTEGNCHYKLCTVCHTTAERSTHTDTGNGTCICGYTFPKAACSHTDVRIQQETGYSTKHTVTCKQCGETWREDCVAGERYYCTDPTTCAKCGRVMAEAKSSHRWSSWTTTGSTHERHCVNLNCHATESGSHDFSSSSSSDCTKGGTCSICGYRGSASAYSDHNWSSWTNNGAGAHTRHCLNPGCTAQQSATHTAKASECGAPTVCAECGYIMGAATDHNWGHWVNAGSGGHYRSCLTCDAKQSTNHSGGTATCSSPAICSGCGATYGSKNSSNHAGGTEVRGQKNAEVGVTGYTGDTYCLGCGALLQKGTETAALAASHTHSYGTTLHKDSTHHWKQCACGSVGEKEEHTFKDGVCTVCGEADPDYKPAKADHVHTYGTDMKSNETSHWKVCKECGAAADTAAHTYGDKYESDGTNHWRVCTACGYKHSEPHDFQSGSCAVCGAKEDPNASPAPSSSTKPSESPAPGTSASPAPSASEEPAPAGSTAPAPSTSTAPAPSTIPAPAEPVRVENFADLDTEAEYYEPVKQVVEMGLMSGVSSDSFAPEETFTRAQVATLLYNLAGKPEVTSTATFSDMGQAGWAVNAVSWAQESGVVNGAGNNTFDPNGKIDRQTLAAILYNYAKANGYNTEIDEAAVAAAKDLDKASSWFQEAMNWAVSVGLFTPDENGNVNPDEITQRSMVAVVTVIFMDNEDITVPSAE